MFTFMAQQFKRDQKIIIFSHSLGLTLFQPRGPLGVLRMGGTYQLYDEEPVLKYFSVMSGSMNV